MKDLSDKSMTILSKILTNPDDMRRVETANSNGQDSVIIRCPVHDDTHPSCSVSLSKALYHCFSCGAGGSLFKLYRDFTGEKFNGGGFSQFHKEVSSIDLSLSPRVHFDFIPIDITSVYESKPSVDYVKKRGFTNKVVDSMEMKFAREALTVDTDNPNKKVSFINRLIIPIYEENKVNDTLTTRTLLSMEGRDVYGEQEFVARGDSGTYKKCLYPIGSSCNTLYQWQRLKKDETLYVMEGLMDVAALRTSDRMQNSTALFGASISERQLYLLKKFKDIVYIIDNDPAGEKSLKTLKSKLGKKFRWLIPPVGCKDVNEIITKKKISIDQAIDSNWLSYIRSSDDI